MSQRIRGPARRMDAGDAKGRPPCPPAPPSPTDSIPALHLPRTSPHRASASFPSSLAFSTPTTSDTPPHTSWPLQLLSHSATPSQDSLTAPFCIPTPPTTTTTRCPSAAPGHIPPLNSLYRPSGTAPTLPFPGNSSISPLPGPDEAPPPFYRSIGTCTCRASATSVRGHG